jgi:photosystem II stability/assembly factor-like uncharacterized protein
MKTRPAPRSVRLWVATVATGSLLAGALPAVAQEDGGTLTAEVTIAEADEACLLLSVDTLDFGMLDFDDAASSDPYTVSSCSTGGQELYASGTDATGDGATPAGWSLGNDPDQRGVDQFAVDAALDGVGTAWLATDPTLIGALAAGASAPAVHELVLPPAGSAGAGQTMSFDLLWTAVLGAGPEWIQQTSGTTVNLQAVDFADDQHGWVVGNSGTILHSSDGGSTWSPQESGTTVTLWDVDFVDTNRGWVVGNSGTILTTTDGGATWTQQGAGTNAALFGLHMHDANRGWVVGLSATIRTTADGGTTWTAQPSGEANGRSLAAVTFLDDQRGWAAGADVIVKTTDGGGTWVGQDPGIISILDVSFADEQNGWAVSNSAGATVTTDGGVTWTPRSVTTDTDVDVVMSAVDFLSEDRGWAAGTQIVTTADGGTTWIEQCCGDIVSNFNDILMISPERGWAVGFEGQIYRYG